MVKFEGGAVSLCGLRHQGVQSVGVAQVGQELLAVDWSAWVPGCVAVNGGWKRRASGVCPGTGRVSEGLCAAAGCQEGGW